MLFTAHDVSGFLELSKSFWTLWSPVSDVSFPAALFDTAAKEKFISTANEAVDLAVSQSTAATHPNSWDVSTHVPHRTVNDAFLKHAFMYPDFPAVVDHTGHTCSYGQLQLFSSHVASYLLSRGVSRGARVCLLAGRSIVQVAGIFGVLRAGAAYVPLDGDVVTDQTLLSIVEDARPSLILVSRAFLSRLVSSGYSCVCLEELLEMFVSANDVLQPISPSDCAYVIFTSGTTGRPKGVAVTHGNLTNLLCVYPGNLGISPGTRVAQLLNVAFDMCAWETLRCLMNGGTLYLRGPRRSHWLQVLKSVDVVISTPSILAQHDPLDYPNIRVVATAGEPCPQALADTWGKHTQFFNSYGPTEVTIVNTMSLHVPGTPISIGRPTPNNTVYILDELLKPVPIGKPGTIWATGAGICQGYLNRPELNKSKFRNDPFSDGVMYNTGDLGRWRADGNIEPLGRVDNQVKVKGFRVELDGISTAMATCQGVHFACSLLVHNELWGFYNPPSVPSEAIRQAVAKIQPYYAVPSKYLGVADWPLTSNGKVDRRTLERMAHVQ